MSSLSYLRVLPLAAAAVASVATSRLPESISITGATPPSGETGVSADVQPEITLDMDGGAAPAAEVLTLRRAGDGELVAGHAERTTPGGQAFVYRFVPDAPLPDGDYLLVLEIDGRELYTDEVEALDPEASWSGPVGVRFSTVSSPKVRRASLYYGDGTGYVSFSQDMDVASLAAHMKILDATGDELPVTQTWLGDRLHTLQFTSQQGAADILLEPGILAADGSEMTGLPMVLDGI
jgi:hypothetical protein